jgi:hypothetical protein
MSERTKKRVDWRKRFGSAKAPHVVTLESAFAGVPAGSRMLISSPGEIAAYLAAIPRGETRTVARMRSDLARRAEAAAMCPVTTAIYLRVVAECALEELAGGKDLADVVPFWRLVAPTDKVAAKLSCGPEGVEHLRRLDAAAPASA